MVFCPSCSTENSDPDARFCKHCGRNLDNTVRDGWASGAVYERAKTPKKYIVLPVVSMLLFLIASGVIVVGGMVDFDYSYDDDGNIILEDSSVGLFSDPRWEITDYSMVPNDNSDHGVSAHGSKIKLIAGETTVYKVTFYCKTLAGTERGITKDVSYGEFKEYKVDFNYSFDSVTSVPCSFTVRVSTSDFLEYKNDDIERYPGSQANEELVRAYIDVLENDTIASIARQLDMITAGLPQEEKINFIMAFVQNGIRYEEDIHTMGAEEYWKYPIETLFSRTGDCEDVSLLTMALFKASFGDEADVALVLFWGTSNGHAMAAISASSTMTIDPHSEGVAEQNTQFYMIDAKTYYVCETTATGWKLGWISHDYAAIKPNMLIAVR